MNDSKNISNEVNRLNPDSIKFEWDGDENKVYYTEVADCSDRSIPEDSSLEEEVRKDKEFFQQIAALNPQMNVVDVETEIDNQEETIKLVMEQNSVEALASLTGELLGYLLEEDKEIFYSKFKPFVERAREEKNMEL